MTLLSNNKSKTATYLLLSCLLTQFTAGCTTLSSGLSSVTRFAKGPYAQFPASQAPHTLLKKPLAAGRLSSNFGYRMSPSGLPLPKKHGGIDYRADKGTVIFAAGNGVIIGKRVSSSYGNVLTVEHSNGFKTLYAHMDAFGAGIEKGSKVSKGQPIGTVGTTGRSTGPHLHYELIYKGKKVNPLF